MRKDKYSAIKLRKQNKSYNEISQKLGIPKSNLVYWFKNENWSKDIKKNLSQKTIIASTKRLILMNKAKKEKWEKWRQGFRDQANSEFQKLKNNELFIVGLMLYWGEGDSKIENSLVRLANIDPKMIIIFINFLQEICLVPTNKIKISIISYFDIDDDKCKNFWSKTLNIPQSQFFKIQHIRGQHPTKRLSYGICNVIVCSRALKEKIFTWLELYKDELIK